MIIKNGERYSFNRKPPKLSHEKWRDYWGVCDWQNRKEYPKNDAALSPEQWRWEFLRRFPTYREDYINQLIQEDDGHGISLFKCFEYGLSDLIDPKLSYKFLPKNFCFERYPLVMRSSRGAYSPNFPDANMSDDYMSLVDEEKDSTVDVRFDLRRPLSPQIINATNSLKLIQKKCASIKRWRGSNNLVECLRVLDAHQAGTPKKVIADEFYGGHQERHAKMTKVQRTIDLVTQLWRRL